MATTAPRVVDRFEVARLAKESIAQIGGRPTTASYRPQASWVAAAETTHSSVLIADVAGLVRSEEPFSESHSGVRWQ
jgi:hypothetical protein